MIHVASEFGTSGNGLAKVCGKLEVPYPPRGHWAKHAAGKAPPAAALPRRKQSAPGTAIKMATQSEAALERLGAIDVSDRLTRPHPIIAGWLEDRKRQRQEARLQRHPWRRDLYRVAEFTDADRRRHRILNALFRALEKEGGMVVQTDRRELRYEKESDAAGADTVRDWIEWAEERIAVKDPLGSRPADIFEEIARVNAWSYRG